MYRNAVAALATIVLFTSHAGAQVLQPPRFANAVSTLSVGNTIKFVSNGTTVVGRYGGLDGDVLLLNASNTTQRYPVSDVDVLWVQRNRIKRGAIIGGITGGVLGAAFGLAVRQIACETDACVEDNAPLLLFGGLGAAGGAGLGALIGNAVKYWKQVYP